MKARRVLALLLLLLLLLLGTSLGEDTVAEDLGVHQLDRLVELLTRRECEDLLAALSHPEDNVFQQLERLAPENNRLDLRPRVTRDTGTDVTRDADELQCRTALTDWLLKHGEQTYYDRLARALQRISRTDVAIEVAKNINQDKSLTMKRYVDDYHKRVGTSDSHGVRLKTEGHAHDRQQAHTRQVRDLRWSDLELVVERAPLPPYRRRPLDGAWALLYGLLLGLGGALLVGVPLLLLLLRVSHGDRLACWGRGAATCRRRRGHAAAGGRRRGSGGGDGSLKVNMGKVRG